VKLINGNFVSIRDILNKLNISRVDGILADIGVSSPMFDDVERGFSYHLDAKLDMRMNQQQKFSAYDLINKYDKDQFAELFRKYGEIYNASNVIKKIIEYRTKKPIETTLELVEIIKSGIPRQELFKDKHPARKYFQAIRIEVNNELVNLEKFLNVAAKLLNSHGCLSIITFHSLEDKIVKNKFNDLIASKIPKEIPILKDDTIEYDLYNKNPITATDSELEENKRARSAKLRTIIKR
jgi:16S rRNA (cytosine1402-N4)-methyltransferase